LDAEIEEVLRTSATVGEAATRLVEMALVSGKDNVTCIVLEKLKDDPAANRLPTFMDRDDMDREER